MEGISDVRRIMLVHAADRIAILANFKPDLRNSAFLYFSWPQKILLAIAFPPSFLKFELSSERLS